MNARMCISWLKVQAIKKYCRGVLQMGTNVKRALRRMHFRIGCTPL